MCSTFIIQIKPAPPATPCFTLVNKFAYKLPSPTSFYIRPQAAFTVCFICAEFCAFVLVIHPGLFCPFFSRCGNDQRHCPFSFIHPSPRRVFRPGTKFCYALTSIDSQSECITELRPGTYNIHCPIFSARITVVTV